MASISLLVGVVEVCVVEVEEDVVVLAVEVVVVVVDVTVDDVDVVEEVVDVTGIEVNVIVEEVGGTVDVVREQAPVTIDASVNNIRVIIKIFLRLNILFFILGYLPDLLAFQSVPEYVLITKSNRREVK